MTKNPILNALAAAGYIVLIVTLIHFISPGPDTKDTFVTPIVVLSLFTLSAAMMSYIFLYEPFKLYFADQKEQALNLFLKTVGSFAVLTLVFIVLHSLGF